MAGVALCAIDGLLVWRVLGLVTSTLCSCGFPKAGLPSWSGPFPVALIPCSLLSLVVRFARSAAQVTSPSKRTFLACLLFICLAVLLALSGCPFWPLSGPNPAKRASPALPVLVCLAVLLAVARLGERAAEIVQSGLAQLIFCFVSSCPVAVLLCSFLSLVLRFVR